MFLLMTCKDCLHFEVCDSGRHIGEYVKDDGVYSDGVEKECAAFKDKYTFIEMPWRRQMREFARVKHNGVIYDRISACTVRVIRGKSRGMYREITQLELLHEASNSVSVVNPKEIEFLHKEKEHGDENKE